jgi:phosphohistidine phosphatase
MTDTKNNASLLEQKGKLLLLIRHAKSSWEIGTLNDFDRPLNERGKKDAPAMAERLKAKKINIDAFVSSPAKRAKETANYFAITYKHSVEDIMLIPKLYHASTEVFFDTVQALDNRLDCVALFSHNPGITAFVNLVVDSIMIDNMPTCGILGVKVHTNHWAQFALAKKDFLFFDYPKSV